MAEKNTHSILETIKKKMLKIDQKSEQPAKVSAGNEEFQYISSGAPKVAAEPVETKTSAPVAPKFEDNLGLDLEAKPAPAAPAAKSTAMGSFDDFSLDDLDLDEEEKISAAPAKPNPPFVANAAPAAPQKIEDEIDEEDLEEFEDDVDFEEEEELEEEEEELEEAVATEAPVLATPKATEDVGPVDWLGNPVVSSIETDELNLDAAEEIVEKVDAEKVVTTQDELKIEEELNLEEVEEEGEEDLEEEAGEDLEEDLEEEAEEDLEEEAEEDLEEEAEEDLEEEAEEDLEEEADEDLEEEEEAEEDLEEEAEEDLEEEAEEDLEEEAEEDLEEEEEDLEEEEEDLEEEEEDLEEEEEEDLEEESEEDFEDEEEDLDFSDLEQEGESVKEQKVEKELPSFENLTKNTNPVQSAQVLVSEAVKTAAQKIEPVVEKHEIDLEFEKELMGFRADASEAISTPKIPPINQSISQMPVQNNVSVMNQQPVEIKAAETSPYDSTVRQVGDSVKKLLDAKNVVSGISNFSQSPALAELALHLMEPKIEKWFNDNLPELVEKIVREEIKKMIPRE